LPPLASGAAPYEDSCEAGCGEFADGIVRIGLPEIAVYTSPEPPLSATPFISPVSGQNFGPPFPYTFAALNSSRNHPDGSFDWSNFAPISGIPGYDIHNRAPYTEEWMLSIERQAGPNTVLSASYAGTASHRQPVLVESNPGNPALCLSLDAVVLHSSRVLWPLQNRLHWLGSCENCRGYKCEFVCYRPWYGICRALHRWTNEVNIVRFSHGGLSCESQPSPSKHGRGILAGRGYAAHLLCPNPEMSDLPASGFRP
jgi:hypothetical protein